MLDIKYVAADKEKFHNLYLTVATCKCYGDEPSFVVPGRFPFSQHPLCHHFNLPTLSATVCGPAVGACQYQYHIYK